MALIVAVAEGAPEPDAVWVAVTEPLPEEDALGLMDGEPVVLSAAVAEVVGEAVRLLVRLAERVADALRLPDLAPERLPDPEGLRVAEADAVTLADAVRESVLLMKLLQAATNVASRAARTAHVITMSLSTVNAA